MKMGDTEGELNCSPLHYKSGEPVWKSLRRRICDDSVYENGEFHWGTGLEPCMHEEIACFMTGKGNAFAELEDEKWLCDLAFMCDTTEHLITLNMRRQGRKQPLTDMHVTVKAFRAELHLRENQTQQGNCAHFLTSGKRAHHCFPRREMCRKTEDTQKQNSAGDLRFELFTNPFAVNVDSAPEH